MFRSWTGVCSRIEKIWWSTEILGALVCFESCAQHSIHPSGFLWWKCRGSYRHLCFLAVSSFEFQVLGSRNWKLRRMPGVVRGNREQSWRNFKSETRRRSFTESRIRCLERKVWQADIVLHPCVIYAQRQGVIRYYMPEWLGIDWRVIIQDSLWKLPITAMAGDTSDSWRVRECLLKINVSIRVCIMFKPSLSRNPERNADMNVKPIVFTRVMCHVTTVSL